MCETCSGRQGKALCTDFCFPLNKQWKQDMRQVKLHTITSLQSSFQTKCFTWAFYFLNDSGIGFPFRKRLLSFSHTPESPQHQFMGLFLHCYSPPLLRFSFLKVLKGENQIMPNNKREKKKRQTKVEFVGPFSEANLACLLPLRNTRVLQKSRLQFCVGIFCDVVFLFVF